MISTSENKEDLAKLIFSVWDRELVEITAVSMGTWDSIFPETRALFIKIAHAILEIYPNEQETLAKTVFSVWNKEHTDLSYVSLGDWETINSPIKNLYMMISLEVINYLTDLNKIIIPSLLF